LRASFSQFLAEFKSHPELRKRDEKGEKLAVKSLRKKKDYFLTARCFLDIDKFQNQVLFSM
jgi:hypothetical protein